MPPSSLYSSLTNTNKVNVFKLGRTFKALHAALSIAKNGIQPVLPEDLIWRFASKLEFGKDCNKVAEDAIRMAQRMSLDWMVMGRRPSGVCGACLILAARMNNYRRSITEVVYIVKVTTHTIQKRLDEFKMTPSSALTVDEFLNNEFLESAHDPPSFYEKTDEFQKNKKRRKRRRNGHDGLEGVGEDDDDAESQNGEGQANKRQRTGATPNPDQALPTVELRRDADGFAIPPPPIQFPPQPEVVRRVEQPADIPIDPDLVDEIIADHTETSFRKLVENFGDGGDVQPEEENTPAGSGSTRGGQPTGRLVHVPREWAISEEELERQMTEIISDPTTVAHAVRYAEAEKRVAKHMALAMISQKAIPSTEIVGEEEFADDPEVQNFILSPEDAAKKEKMWINQNKGWLRAQQIKEYKKKQDAKGPPKAKRIRKKKPRIGEGQTSVASSPGVAVANVMRERNFSTKFNYSAFTAMFEEGNDAGLGSAATSRVASRAGSELGDSTTSSTVPSVVATPAWASGSVPATPAANEDSEIGDPDDYIDNPDDYIDPEAEGSVQAESVADDAEDWKSQFRPNRNLNQDEEDLPEDDTEYADLGFGDESHPFDEEDGAFDGPEDFDDE
jgi:transcription factor IIIB 90 kDa subunit